MFRHTLGVAAICLAVGLCVFGACKGGSSDNASQPDDSAPQVTDVQPSPTAQQMLDARLALCVTADREYQDVKAGNQAQDKDPWALSSQFVVGERAGKIAIRQAWRDYVSSNWSDADCAGLSTAGWANAEGYAGDPLNVPSGAIGAVMSATGYWEP
jgi:hypothetical protein